MKKHKLSQECPFCHKDAWSAGLGQVVTIGHKRLMAHLACARKAEKGER